MITIISLLQFSARIFVIQTVGFDYVADALIEIPVKFPAGDTAYSLVTGIH